MEETYRSLLRVLRYLQQRERELREAYEHVRQHVRQYSDPCTEIAKAWAAFVDVEDARFLVEADVDKLAELR